MAHRLSLRARTDIDDIAYYVSVESSIETADRLLESIYRKFLSIHMLVAGEMISDQAYGRFLQVSTWFCIGSKRTTW